MSIKSFDGIEYIPLEEHKRIIAKLEHIISGMNEEILEEAHEIHELQEKLEEMEYDKIGV